MPAGRLIALVLATALALAAPAPARADTAQVEVSGTQLKITGIPKTPSGLELSYQPAAAAQPAGTGDRFVLTDPNGVHPVNPDCVALAGDRVSCAAAGLLRVDADLGDGDDVFVVGTSKTEGVPKRFAVAIQGGAGADVIRGGVGEDALYGQKGRDVVAGWSGADFLSGGQSTDAVIGFGGDDTLLGDSGRDALFGQKGHDLMFGGAGNDVLLARDGIRDPKLNCGPGKRQRAVTDRRDPPTSNCTGA